MKLRVLVATALVVVFALAAGIAVALGSSPAPPAPAVPSQAPAALTPVPREAWAREAYWLEHENYARLGAPPLMDGPQQPKAAPGGIRVLALGDSNTFGFGLPDHDVAWPRQLEAELNRRTAPGTFRVVTVAAGAASTLTESEWLADPAVLAGIDAVVVGLASNDAVPSGREKALCPSGDCKPLVVEFTQEFRDCAYGTAPAAGLVDGAVPGVQTNCEPEEFAQRLGIPSGVGLERQGTSSPYWGFFLQGVEGIMSAAGSRPVLVLPMLNGTDGDYVTPLLSAFADAGATVVNGKRTAAELARPREVDHLANPVDNHPGPMLTRVFAADAADALLDRLPADVVAAAGRAPAASAPLVSNWLPARMRAEVNTPGTATMRLMLPEARDEGGAPAASAQATTGSPGQDVPCATLGRPHVRVMLRPDLADGTPVSVRLLDGLPQAGVYTVGYDAEGRTVVVWAGAVSAGGSVSFAAGPQARGVLIDAAGPGDGCPAGERLTMRPFTVQLEAGPAAG